MNVIFRVTTPPAPASAVTCFTMVDVAANGCRRLEANIIDQHGPRLERRVFAFGSKLGAQVKAVEVDAHELSMLLQASFNVTHPRGA